MLRAERVEIPRRAEVIVGTAVPVDLDRKSVAARASPRLQALEVSSEVRELLPRRAVVRFSAAWADAREGAHGATSLCLSHFAQQTARFA